MTQEDKELLLRDLCARLPYRTIVRSFIRESGENDEILNCAHIINFYAYDCKPYLRPMSSMTEEEKKEFNSLINSVEERCINAYGKGGYTLAFIEVNDWLNAHHFDYRGLIERGLAIEAPNDMYK